MNSATLTVTEVVRNFSDYISRVAYRGESFVLQKGNKRVAELRPVSQRLRLGDLPTALLKSVPRLPQSDIARFAEDIDTARFDLVDKEPRNPWES